MDDEVIVDVGGRGRGGEGVVTVGGQAVRRGGGNKDEKEDEE